MQHRLIFLLALLSLTLTGSVVRAAEWQASDTDSDVERCYTHPIIDEVKTLRVVTDGDFQRLPVIDNTHNSSLQISFDILSDEQYFLQYQVMHCDANWRPDDLSELDYIDGFQPSRVEEVTPSFNTYINYWHYTLSFPNEELRLLVSGNYAVIFHIEGDPDTPVAMACFSVTEQKAFVGGEVSGITDIDYRQEHQQLTLQCTWSASQLPYLNPASDLQLIVTQNHRPDTRRTLSQPSRMEAGKAYYEHNPALIFEAGNTFRRFEFTDRRYATLGIEQVRFVDPYFEVQIPLQHSRQGAFYLYDRDQHGRYVVNALRVDDVHTEGEYFWADIQLAGAMPSRRGASVYLTGDFTYGELTEPYLMQYDPVLETFHGRVLLKQGHYNFQFLCGEEWTPADPLPVVPSTLGPCEGNYYEAHNEYDVYVYYRAPGERYDRLLGVAQFSL